MTTTPESWDDVGCLRLQVNCLSQDVEDVQLHVSQLQQLNDQLALALEQEQKKERCREQEQKKERCELKINIIATAVLFGCVLALLACVLVLLYTIYAGSAPRLNQRLPDEVWKTYVDDLKASEATALAWSNSNITNGQQLKQKPVNDAVAAREDTDEGTETMVTMSNNWEQAQKATKEKPTLKLSVITDKDFDEQDGHDDAEQTRKELGDKKRQSPPIDLRAFVSVPSEELKQEAIGTTQDELSDTAKPSTAKEKPLTAQAKAPAAKAKLRTTKAKPPTAKAKHDMRASPPLPFQLLEWAHSEASNEVLKRARRGMVWVCFPANVFEQNVKTYAPVFNEVARSQKWRRYPFVYLDTRKIERYSEHFCDDVQKITFVMEKWNDGSDVFRRVFEPHQVVQASLVEEFLNDVHSGKLPEIGAAKGDL